MLSQLVEECYQRGLPRLVSSAQSKHLFQTLVPNTHVWKIATTQPWLGAKSGFPSRLALERILSVALLAILPVHCTHYSDSCTKYSPNCRMYIFHSWRFMAAAFYRPFKTGEGKLSEWEEGGEMIGQTSSKKTTKKDWNRRNDSMFGIPVHLQNMLKVLT